MDLMDDSENDSDYVPEDDVVKEVEKTSKKKSIAGGELNPRKKRQIDELWQEMQEEDKKYISEHVAKTSMLINPAVLERPTKRLKKRADRFLNNFLKQTSSPSSSQYHGISISQQEASVDVKNLVAEAVSKVSKKTTVTEVRKFAGSTVTIEKTVSLSKGAMPTAAPKKPESSIDKVLDAIKGPKLISTVVKSSTDWENYKDKEGIEFDNTVKDGYLGKKEFLERCDVRSFEKERDMRLAGKE